MNLSDAQRFELLRTIYPMIVSWKLTTAPAARDGAAKKVSPDFAAAVWAKKYLKTLSDVLEKDSSNDPSAQGGSSASGFPQ